MTEQTQLQQAIVIAKNKIAQAERQLAQAQQNLKKFRQTKQKQQKERHAVLQQPQTTQQMLQELNNKLKKIARFEEQSGVSNLIRRTGKFSIRQTQSGLILHWQPFIRHNMKIRISPDTRYSVGIRPNNVIKMLTEDLNIGKNNLSGTGDLMTGIGVLFEDIPQPYRQKLQQQYVKSLPQQQKQKRSAKSSSPSQQESFVKSSLPQQQKQKRSAKSSSPSQQKSFVKSSLPQQQKQKRSAKSSSPSQQKSFGKSSLPQQPKKSLWSFFK